MAHMMIKLKRHLYDELKFILPVEEHKKDWVSFS